MDVDRHCVVLVGADLIEAAHVIVGVTLAVGAGEWAAVEGAAVAHAVIVVAIAHAEVVAIMDAVVLPVVSAVGTRYCDYCGRCGGGTGYCAHWGRCC